eukprot:gene3638-4154_t
MAHLIEDEFESDEENYHNAIAGMSEDHSFLITGATEGTIKVAKKNHPRCIIHVDFDCFYAQVEMIRNPFLKGKPVAVYQKHALVTSNYIARELGVKKMSSKTEGLKACPGLVLINGEDLTPYREFSAKMFAFFKDFSPIVERVGLDENFIDITAKVDELLSTWKKQISVRGHCYGFDKTDLPLETILANDVSNHCDCNCIKRLTVASMIASDLRSALHAKLGLTSSAGVAHNKVLAKLIGKTHKPNQQTTIFPALAVKFLSEKKVREIPGIGSRTNKLLDEMGVTIVSHLFNKTKESLINHFGLKIGTFLHNIAYGIDNNEVNQSESVQKTISEEDSFRKLTNYNEVKKQMEILVNKLLLRVDCSKRVPKTIKLTLRKHFNKDNYSRESRQAAFNSRLLEVNDESEKVRKIIGILLSLFDKMVDRTSGFDLAVINVGFANFEEKAPPSSSISNFFAKLGGEVDQTTTATRHNEKEETVRSASPVTFEERKRFTFESITPQTAPIATSVLASATSIHSEPEFAPKCHVMPLKRAPQIPADFSQAVEITSSAETSNAEVNISFNSSQDSNSFSIPDNTDPAVFRQLPSHIQEELLNTWKNETKQKRRNSTVVAPPPNKKQKLSKSKNVKKSKNILNYFSK